MKSAKTIDLGNGRTKEVWYYTDGTTQQEVHRLNDKAHREDGPADIWYYEDGTISREYYYLNGKYHREDGPAIIGYYKDGTISREYYYLNSKELTKEQFEQHLLKKKLQII